MHSQCIKALWSQCVERIHVRNLNGSCHYLILWQDPKQKQLNPRVSDDNRSQSWSSGAGTVELLGQWCQRQKKEQLSPWVSDDDRKCDACERLWQTQVQFYAYSLLLAKSLVCHVDFLHFFFLVSSLVLSLAFDLHIVLGFVVFLVLGLNHAFVFSGVDYTATHSSLGFSTRTFRSSNISRALQPGSWCESRSMNTSLPFSTQSTGFLFPPG